MVLKVVMVVIVKAEFWKCGAMAVQLRSINYTQYNTE